MGAGPADVLIFVEDPGAANFVAALPEALARRGHSTCLAAAGVAIDWLRQFGSPVFEMPVNGDARRLLAVVAPRVLVAGTAENRDSLGLALIELARKSGIASIGVLDSSTHLEFRFRGRTEDPLAYCPDFVIVPDRNSAAELAKLGLDARRVVIAGHPHWDRVLEAAGRFSTKDRIALRRRLFGEAAAARKVVVFASEVSAGMNSVEFSDSEHYTLAGSGASSGRTEIVIEEFLLAIEPFRQETHLVLRLHPKESAVALAPYRTLFDSISQGGASLEVVFSADAVVGMTSMLLVEAELMDRPTLSIIPRPCERAWLLTLAAGITPVATTRAAVREEVARLLRRSGASSRGQLKELLPSGALGRVVETIAAHIAGPRKVEGSR